MKIKRNEKLEQQILEASRNFLEKQNRAEGVHVSDLLTPRKAYWRALDPKPLTKEEIGYFIAGRAHHEVILSIMHKRGIVGTETDEGSKEFKGIHYSPDYNLGFLAEIKSNRRQYEPDEDKLEDEYEHYLKQLTKYMAFENKRKAALIVFFISMRQNNANKTTSPETRAYTVTLTLEEITQIRKESVLLKNKIVRAIATKDHTSLPLCPAWMCTRGYKKPYIACEWYEQCKPDGRYPLTILIPKSAKKKRKVRL